jgi:hypothetical protein
MEIVRDFKTLKEMSKAKLVELHSDTKKFSYVYDGKVSFTHKDKQYKTFYFDGCFYPFIVVIK